VQGRPIAGIHISGSGQVLARESPVHVEAELMEMSVREWIGGLLFAPLLAGDEIARAATAIVIVGRNIMVAFRTRL